MIRRNILGRPLKSTAAAVFHCLKPHHTSSPDVAICRSRHNPLTSRIGRFSTDSAVTDSAQPTELTRVVDGCDYEHWLVVTEPPNGYPQRSEIVHRYIQTLAMALGRYSFKSVVSSKNIIKLVSQGLFMHGIIGKMRKLHFAHLYFTKFSVSLLLLMVSVNHCQLSI